MRQIDHQRILFRNTIGLKLTPTFEIFRFVSILTRGALLNDLFEDDGNMELKSLKPPHGKKVVLS